MLTVAMSDPLLFTLVQDLEFQTGYRIKKVVATREEIIDAIHRWYPDKALMRVPQAGAGLEGRGGSRLEDRGAHRTSTDEAAHAGEIGALADGFKFGGRSGEDVFEQAVAPTGVTAETAPIIEMV